MERFQLFGAAMGMFFFIIIYINIRSVERRKKDYFSSKRRLIFFSKWQDYHYFWIEMLNLNIKKLETGDIYKLLLWVFIAIFFIGGLIITGGANP